MQEKFQGLLYGSLIFVGVFIVLSIILSIYVSRVTKDRSMAAGNAK